MPLIALSIASAHSPSLSLPFFSKASVATQAAAAAEGRAAAAEIELLRTRAKLLSAEEKYARVEREAAAVLTAAREAHMHALQEVR